MQKILGFLRLARPANVVTAFSDIGAGSAIGIFALALAYENVSGARPEYWNTELAAKLALLLLATLGLYGGGVVMNDVFDAELDAVERPERPIPSGLIPKKQASAWGLGLLLLGVVSAGLVHLPWFFSTSFFLAVCTAAAALLYDAWGKHQDLIGPINMGLCRGLNLLLGMSIFPPAIREFWYLALVPVLYIAAITMISRGEVHGGKKTTLYAGAIFYGVVITAILLTAWNNKNGWSTLAFLLLFSVMIFPPLFRAMKEPVGPKIGKAVKAGVLGLILMNAGWAAAFGALPVALALLLLLPLSLWLAKAFAVT